MILTVENTAKIGMPIRIRDAEGNAIENAIWADTETGECVILHRFVDPHTNKHMRSKRTYPAPLTWERIHGKGN